MGKRKVTSRKVSTLSNEIISILVHDINNLLGIIKGYFDRALLEGEDIPKPLVANLNIGLQATEDLSRLVSNLADIAKIEENLLKLRLEKADINELIRLAAAKVKLAARGARVALTVDLKKGSALAYIDKGLILRALISLMSSAIRSSAPGGRIRVSAKSAGSVLKVSVEDTGFWIPQRYRKKIFEKYAQAEIKEANLRRGRGLNLVFCKLAVEAHKGRIWMDCDRRRNVNTVVFMIPAGLKR